MLKEIVGKIWRLLPYKAKRILIRVSQPTFTVSVGAVVLNENNEILLLNHVLRSASGWGIPGGFIGVDEQPHEGLQREIFEETNLKLENIRLCWVKTVDQHIEMIFIAHGKGEAIVKSLEINSIGWFTFDKMPRKMSQSQYEIIAKVLSKN